MLRYERWLCTNVSCSRIIVEKRLFWIFRVRVNIYFNYKKTNVLRSAHRKIALAFLSYSLRTSNSSVPHTETSLGIFDGNPVGISGTDTRYVETYDLKDEKWKKLPYGSILPVDNTSNRTLIQFSTVTVQGDGREFLWVFGGNIGSEPSGATDDAFKYEGDENEGY